MHTIVAKVQGVALRLSLHPTRMFVPNLMSWWSAAWMHVRPGEAFADIGCGSGLHAILAARLGARRAVGVDVNPLALRVARENARRNGVADRCRFFLGSLGGPLRERGLRVDAAVYNAPHFPGASLTPGIPRDLRRCVDGGPDGSRLHVRFIRELRTVLRPEGRLYEPLVGWSAPLRSIRVLREEGFRWRELARCWIPVWGRGNNSRDWFLAHPGRHRFTFRHPPVRNGLARLLEVYAASARSLNVRKTRRVDLFFREARPRGASSR